MTDSSRFRLDVSFGEASFSAEGEASLVLEAFATFREDLSSRVGARTPIRVKATPPPADEGSLGPDDAAEGPDPGSAFAKGTPLSAFLKEKEPEGNDEVAAAMAVWANANQGTTEFTASVMEDLWSRSGRKKPRNISRDLKKAAQEGWLDQASRGKYTLPSYGINFVRGLPDPKE